MGCCTRYGFLHHSSLLPDATFKSLKATLSFLHNPKTPVVIRTSVPTLVSLINIISPTSCLEKNDRGKQRFDQLSSILGEGIIGSIWMYASRDLGAMHASIDVLPLIVDALGIGSVRYLKVRHTVWTVEYYLNDGRL